MKYQWEKIANAGNVYFLYFLLEDQTLHKRFLVKTKEKGQT